MRATVYVNANLGEYHVPVNADIPNMIVEFVPEEDRYVNAMVSRTSVRLRWSGGGGCKCDLSRHGQAYPRFANYTDKLL